MTHVAITGASSGIGEALAREYLRAGHPVSLIARRRELLEKLATDEGGRSKVLQADLSDVGNCTDWIAAAESELGPIEVLINNAGVQIVGPTVETQPDDGDALLRLNLHTPLRIMHAVLPAMLARRSGTVVNIASVAALAPTPGMTWYNAAKAGLAAASESLRGELRRSGVRIVTVYPGPVDTPMAQRALEVVPDDLSVRALPVGKADVLARKIRRAVDKGQARVIYPSSYTVSRHMPGATRWVLDVMTPPFKGKQ